MIMMIMYCMLVAQVYKIISNCVKIALLTFKSEKFKCIMSQMSREFEKINKSVHGKTTQTWLGAPSKRRYPRFGNSPSHSIHISKTTREQQIRRLACMYVSPDCGRTWH